LIKTSGVSGIGQFNQARRPVAVRKGGLLSAITVHLDARWPIAPIEEEEQTLRNADQTVIRRHQNLRFWPVSKRLGNLRSPKDDRTFEQVSLARVTRADSVCAILICCL
jgi:hypothetical protein